MLAYLRRQQGRLAEGLGGSFAIATADQDRAVGQIGLWPKPCDAGRASVGYWVVPSAWRRGIATAALKVLSAWGLGRPGLVRLELYVEPWNEGSWRAAEAAGYQREGLLRSWQVVGDERRDMYIYALLPDGEATMVERLRP